MTNPRLVAAAERGLVKPASTAIARIVGCSEETVRAYFADPTRVSVEMRARIDTAIGMVPR